MRIGLDIQSTVGFKTGIGYYASALLGKFRGFKDLDFRYYRNDSVSDLNTVKRIY